ncbi:uncharacterized protein YgbK (DUF1537 family) [Bacillus chungangensis]|uniref:Uncharacterized protein YgbK (DUF1537 family) n=1 Tax=Bacillus chungangensis TaxID=587633 RepID=A0ABT9WUN7_9BACI|nr:uncharacterized protein YgbK (DUF1537 family) [Bacillus chungangensis]
MTEKIGMIADDLTGANDAGVQLAKKGLSSTVLFDYRSNHVQTNSDVLIVDTDSRAKSEAEAYEAVSKAAALLIQGGYGHIYKKVDSTLRGNIAVELAALEQAYQPDLVVFAPAFPKMNRQTIQGHHFVNGTLITETEFGKDPKTPVTESYIPALLQEHIQSDITLIDFTLLQSSCDRMMEVIIEALESGKKWFVCDSKTEADLEKIAKVFVQLRKRIVWAGSAGLSEYLTQVLKINPVQAREEEHRQINKTLLVSGSLSEVTKNQLAMVEKMTKAHFIEIDPIELIKDSIQIDHLIKDLKAHEHNEHFVLYVASSDHNRAAAKAVGQSLGLTETEVSEAISRGLGVIAKSLLYKFTRLNGLVLTGGDTAKAVCSQLEITEMQLYSEVEPGLPFGKLQGEKAQYWAITKAGGFGNEQSLVNALKYMTRKVKTNDAE